MSRWRCWPNQGSRDIDFARGILAVRTLQGAERVLTEFSLAVEGREGSEGSDEDTEVGQGDREAYPVHHGVIGAVRLFND